MVQFSVIDNQGRVAELESPTDMGLSLMEILKASDYPVLATCGGMALCATCHVEIVEGIDRLPEANDAELDMIDTLPNAVSNSRLACQIRISEALQGAVLRVSGDGN